MKNFILSVVYIGLFLCLLPQNSLCGKHLCPKVEPVADFNITKFLGDWYLVIANKKALPIGDSCHRSNLNLINDTILEVRQNWFAENKTPLKNFMNFTINPNKPGVFRTYDRVIIHGFLSSFKKNVPVDLVIIDTDYENYQLAYSCTDIHHFWEHEKKSFFFIALRSRYFDSLRTIIPLLEKLKSLDANLNSIISIDNEIECPN